MWRSRRLVLEMLGLPTLITWVMALGFGLVQMAVWHWTGEMFAAWFAARTEGKTAGGLLRSGKSLALVVATIVVPALALAFLMAWLRADYLSTQNAALGGGPGAVDFPLALATFCCMQLVLDGFAWLLGLKYGHPSVKALIAVDGRVRSTARADRRACRRYDKCEARFGAALAAALGLLDLVASTIRKTWADQRSASAALYAGICAAADPLTAGCLQRDHPARGGRRGVQGDRGAGTRARRRPQAEHRADRRWLRLSSARASGSPWRVEARRRRR